MGSNPSGSKTPIAVVGTGLAGLVVAHLLHNDPLQRYHVTLFEKQDRISLSSASVTVEDSHGRRDIIDVPMRAFAPGYYRHMKAMLDFFRVHYEAQKFLFAFSTTSPLKGEAPPYYVHASGLHRLPSCAQGTSTFRWLKQVAYLGLCFLWLSICCYFVAPRRDESFEAYLRRIYLPERFVMQYLLPLISSVATCSHRELLQFPAQDFVTYRKRLLSSEHFCLTHGIQDVQQKLVEGIDLRLATEVHEIASAEGQNRLHWRTQGKDGPENDSQSFAHVVIATSPDIVGKLVPSLSKVVSKIPTTHVRASIIQAAGAQSKLSVVKDVPAMMEKEEKPRTRIMSGTQLIALKTHMESPSWTEAHQLFPSGACVAVNAPEAEQAASVLSHAHFTRTLRTVESRALTNRLFGEATGEEVDKSAEPQWTNGTNGIWLAGSWCWDGMVLLEGCVVSASRIATKLGVEIPW